MCYLLVYFTPCTPRTDNLNDLNLLLDHVKDSEALVLLLYAVGLVNIMSPTFLSLARPATVLAGADPTMKVSMATPPSSLAGPREGEEGAELPPGLTKGVRFSGLPRRDVWACGAGVPLLGRRRGRGARRARRTWGCASTRWCRAVRSQCSPSRGPTPSLATPSTTPPPIPLHAPHRPSPRSTKIPPSSPAPL